MAWRATLLTWALIFMAIVGAFYAGGSIASDQPVVMTTAEANAQ
jgi:hypothetical protein